MCRKKASFLSEPSPFVCKSAQDFLMTVVLFTLNVYANFKIWNKRKRYVWTDLKILLS